MPAEPHVVAGVGEIGKPLLEMLSGAGPALGYDAEPARCSADWESARGAAGSVHICMPFGKKFLESCSEMAKMFGPSYVAIHSTVPPGTTDKLQERLDIPVIYSATRGVHSRMAHDLRRYTKFYSSLGDEKCSAAESDFVSLMRACKIRTQRMSTPVTVELAKILVDTTYYGWLITYSQMTKVIMDRFGVDYDEAWQMSEESHEFLGNRPKMFPGFIGGHCVIPNLDLVPDDPFGIIRKTNTKYAEYLKEHPWEGPEQGR